MRSILFLHILGGALAVITGYVALFAPKGRRLHRLAGLAFVGSMLLMGFGAGVVGYLRDLITWTGGISVAYYVITATLTVRRRNGTNRLLDGALMLIPIVLAVRSFNGGLVALDMPGAQIQGIPAGMMFVSAALMLMAVAGDARVILCGPLRGNQRLARHLWRMCYALFSATGSFFLIAKRVPEVIRAAPIRMVLAFLPLVMLFYWLWRVRSKRALRGVTVAPLQPGIAA